MKEGYNSHQIEWIFEKRKGEGLPGWRTRGDVGRVSDWRRHGSLHPFSTPCLIHLFIWLLIRIFYHILWHTGKCVLVDQDALVEALQTLKVSKVATLNVVHPGLLPRDHSLLKTTTLTPHTGSATHQARWQVMEILVESILAPPNGLLIPKELLLKWSYAGWQFSGMKHGRLNRGKNLLKKNKRKRKRNMTSKKFILQAYKCLPALT